MPAVVEGLLSLLALAMVPLGVLALMTHVPFRWPGSALRRRHGAPETPTARPIEEVANDVRRISRRYHQPGMRFAQYEGRRRAYDRALADASDMLGIDHLLGVLPPGPQLDAERARVEAALVAAGLLPEVAA